MGIPMSPFLRLFLSLLVNGILAGWIAWALIHRPSPPAPIPTPPPVPVYHEPPPPETNPTVLPALSPAPTPFHWRQVESTNYATYIANLRAIHCPERVIRSLIAVELEDNYIQQRQQLMAPWQGVMWNEAARALRSPEKWFRQMEPINKEMERKDKEFQAERDRLLKTLLGDPPPPTPAPPAPPRVADTLSGYLAAAKQSQIQAIEQKYSKTISEIYQKNRGKPAADLQVLVKEQNQFKLQEIQTLLTSEEFAEYRLRTSGAATLRYQVYDFEATPDEWRELIRKKMDFDEAHPIPPGNTPEARAQREAWPQSLNQLDTQYQSVLGTERFAAFQRAQQGDYQDILRVVERCELPSAAAVQVYDMKHAFEESARQLRQNTALGAEQRTIALEAMRRETERSVRQALGDRGFQTYQRYRGDWLEPVQK
jgi:hypothetical protein